MAKHAIEVPNELKEKLLASQTWEENELPLLTNPQRAVLYRIKCAGMCRFFNGQDSPDGSPFSLLVAIRLAEDASAIARLEEIDNELLGRWDIMPAPPFVHTIRWAQQLRSAAKEIRFHLERRQRWPSDTEAHGASLIERTKQRHRLRREVEAALELARADKDAFSPAFQNALEQFREAVALEIDAADHASADWAARAERAAAGAAPDVSEKDAIDRWILDCSRALITKGHTPQSVIHKLLYFVGPEQRDGVAYTRSVDAIRKLISRTA